MAEIAIINAGFKPAGPNIEFADIGCAPSRTVAAERLCSPKPTSSPSGTLFNDLPSPTWRFTDD